MGQDTGDERRATGDGPAAGDFGSLKEAAQKMIAKGKWTGINPHKVLRLCDEFERLRATGDELDEGERARVVTTMGRLVDEARHRFDDCRNNMEDGSSGGYGDDLSGAIGLLAELKKGTETVLSFEV